MTRLKIITVNDIIKVKPDDTMSHALAKLTTAHDAAFVFDEKNKFTGVINPYYCVIKSSYPSNAKVEHCLFHPPKLKINFPVQKIAELLIESKIHYLPMFDLTDKFIGIISARRLLFQFRDSPLFKMKIREVLRTKNKSLVTIYEDDSISAALNIFKQSKISKLIVINHDFKLRGILSYYDLIHYLISPKSSQHRGEREGDRRNFYSLKVKNFAKTYVLTLNKEDALIAALDMIIEKRIGSVVIVDNQRHPIGIITTRDFLRLLVKRQSGEKFQMISRNLSEKSRQILGGFFNHFAYITKKIPDVARAKLFVKEKKQGGLFEVILSLIPTRGNPKVIKREGKNLGKVLQKIHIKKEE